VVLVEVGKPHDLLHVCLLQVCLLDVVGQASGAEVRLLVQVQLQLHSEIPETRRDRSKNHDMVL